MKLREIAAPIETPAPAAPPPPRATEDAATVATMTDEFLAFRPTLPAARIVLDTRSAVVEPRITLVAIAPAPLIAPPNVPAKPAANEAAATRAVIDPPVDSRGSLSDESVRASIVIAPLAETASAREIDASTTLTISL